MPRSDSQILAEIEYEAEQDRRVREDIKKAIESHDRNFFEQVILNVLTRLHRTVTDIGGFIDTAYALFRNQLQER